MAGSGSVRELWRYPVKSMQGECVGEIDAGTTGLAGDRTFALRDAETGKVLSAKRWGKLLEACARLDGSGESVTIMLPDGQVLAYGDASTDATLSDWFGRTVTLERADPANSAAYESAVDALDPSSAVLEFPCPPGTFFDAAATHVLTTASLQAARALPGGSGDLWDVRRFRPSILLDCAGDGFAEDAWIGADVRVGSAVLMPFAPTVRCAMPMRSQSALDTGFGPRGALESDKSIVRALADGHNSCLGVYAIVKVPGRIAVGDQVYVETNG